ncbi:MAG: L-threonylcarbamoyladenylate synthase [Patescibacteria group bacterium]
MLQKINSQNPESEIVEQTVEILVSGGVVAYPTDTIYGLGCDAFNSTAIDKIYALKNRDTSKPMSLICRDIEQIKQLAEINDFQEQILSTYLPGPYTFILKAKPEAPQKLVSSLGTLGIRIPDNQFCLEVVKKLNSPLITTSVNLAGQPNLNSATEIDRLFGDQLDLILDAGEINNQPSTIIDLTQSEPKIIRQGAGKFENI